MDCEAFDKIVIDRVFQELDDLTTGAAQRHVAHCSRCRNIEAGLRATREVAALPSLDVPSDFAEAVVSLERRARADLPLRQRLGRIVSVLSDYAMRPQVTMGALLLLMIGSSLFLVRSRPGDGELIQITERGVPEVELNPAGPVPPPLSQGRHTGPVASAQEEPSHHPTAPDLNSADGADSGPGSQQVDQIWRDARTAFQAERYSLARMLAEEVVRAGGPQTASAALLVAQALRRESGCEAALARFEALRVRHGRTAVGEEAAWNAASCLIELGRVQRAKELLHGLLESGTWGPKAKTALRTLPDSIPDSGADSDPAPP